MNYRLGFIFFISLVFSYSSLAQPPDAQNEDELLVQLTGLVVSKDSLSPIPFSSIYIPNRHVGTITNYLGYFSIVAKEKDTVEFSVVGYKRGRLVVPENIEERMYSVVIELTRDTIELEETVIYPWPSKEQFREAFLNLKIPDDDIARAEKNLANEVLAAQFELMGMDGSMNHTNFINSRVNLISQQGMQPANLTTMVNNPLLNPIAWAKFIRAIKNGDFKSKKDR